ncbi:MAG: hypothetical protein KDB80_16215 [Planctomycetes bacterium]|nr:hypothetical protein [Planctomycetota bacterium]
MGSVASLRCFARIRWVVAASSLLLSGCATPALWEWALEPPEMLEVVDRLEFERVERVSCHRLGGERAELRVAHPGAVEAVELNADAAQDIARVVGAVADAEWSVTVSDAGLLAHTTVSVAGSVPVAARSLDAPESDAVVVTEATSPERELFERYAWGVWACGPTAARPAVPFGWIERAVDAAWGTPAPRSRVDAAWASADAGRGTDELDRLEFVMRVDEAGWWAIAGPSLWLAAREEVSFANGRLYFARRSLGRSGGVVGPEPPPPEWFDVAASGTFERRDRRTTAKIPTSVRVCLAVLATPGALILDLVGMWMDSKLEDDEQRAPRRGC